MPLVDCSSACTLRSFGPSRTNGRSPNVIRCSHRATPAKRPDAPKDQRYAEVRHVAGRAERAIDRGEVGGRPAEPSLHECGGRTRRRSMFARANARRWSSWRPPSFRHGVRDADLDPRRSRCASRRVAALPLVMVTAPVVAVALRGHGPEARARPRPRGPERTVGERSRSGRAKTKVTMANGCQVSCSVQGCSL